MAKNGGKLKNTTAAVSEETLRELAEIQRLGNRAVKKAQAENRRHNIPNWYSIDGVIISDREIARNKDTGKNGK